MTTALMATGAQTGKASAQEQVAVPSLRFSTKAWMACGIFLLVLGVYALSGPGRIDIVDGEIRYDVAFNWLAYGRPIVTDNWIGPAMSMIGRDGLRYSHYGAPASVFGIPLVWLGLHTGPPPGIQRSQFLFSLTSSLLGAGIASILFLFYLELGVPTRTALAWTAVSAFATYIWPISASTFDNAQHAFFTLAAVYLGFLSARRNSAIYAVAGGAMAGILFAYQEYFLLIIPVLALSTVQWRSESASSVIPLTTEPTSGGEQQIWFTLRRTWRTLRSLVRAGWDAPGDARAACLRYCLFVVTMSLGIVAALAYNHLRFGSWLDNGQFRFAAQRSYPVWGNPLTGLLTLLVSPGKSVFLYSPVLILAILGIRKLWRRHPELVVIISGSSLSLVLFISCIAFPGGDWCWGPRYLAPLLPLWALALPFATAWKPRRHLIISIVAIGFVVQALALSAENQRFFFEKGVNDFFWAEDPWFYFKHSALSARVGETLSLRDGAPATARYFNSIPIPDWTTYSLLGPPPAVPRRLAPLWMRNFKIFYLPRPWPLWMAMLPRALRPINVFLWLTILLCMSGVGAAVIGWQVRAAMKAERLSHFDTAAP